MPNLREILLQCFFILVWISPIYSLMHNEEVIVRAECAVLLALGSTGGIPWGRWTRKWISVNTPQSSERLLSLKALPVFPASLLTSSAQIWHSRELTRLFYKPLSINVFWHFCIYSTNRCANNSLFAKVNYTVCTPSSTGGLSEDF